MEKRSENEHGLRNDTKVRSVRGFLPRAPQLSNILPGFCSGMGCRQVARLSARLSRHGQQWQQTGMTFFSPLYTMDVPVPGPP